MTGGESPSEKYTFYSGQDYWDELTRRMSAAEAGSRILLMSMTFDPDEPVVSEVMRQLASAAEREVETTVMVDAHSFLVHEGKLGPLWYHSDLPDTMPAVFQRKRDLLDAINQHPHGRYTVLNRPSRRFSLPVAGRSHIKLAIIGNYVLIPSSNLDHTDWINIAVGFEDGRAATQLYDMMRGVAEVGNVATALEGSDQTITVDDATTLYIDAGGRGQSIIYENALGLVDSARQWLMITCQYFPNSTTAQHLLRALRRGVEPEILYAHPRYQGFIGSLGQHASQLVERARLPHSMFAGGLGADDPMLHAKLIACEQGLMSGSHNYVRAGVQLGTAEIALLCRNPELAKKAADVIRRDLHAVQ